MNTVHENLISLLFRFWDKIFRADRSPEEVLNFLEAIRNRTISDEDWDTFISVKIRDSALEKIRMRVEEIWAEDSSYMVKGSIDPRDLNAKGVAEIDVMIKELEETRRSR